MSQKLGIKFTDYGQIYDFLSFRSLCCALTQEKENFALTFDKFFIVKTEQGTGLGEVLVVGICEGEQLDTGASNYLSSCQ